MTNVALVLGGGGIVGMSYHAGVLRALEVEGGIAPDSASLIVGTSAGSVVGAYLRSGWSTEDFWQLAMGTHPRMEAIGPDQPPVLAPAFRTPLGLVRRGLGSAYVMGQSFIRLPLGAVPGPLRRAFPGGIYSMREGKRRFSEELPTEWPDKPLWLVAVDILSGRRVVLGREGGPDVNLQEAVLASCAIPGVYQPVRAASMTLVDGGAHSPTNLDLAVKGGADLIIGVAPMAFDTSGPLPIGVQRLVRQFPTRRLSTEVARARAKGVEVLLLRPSGAELRVHGMNLMRPSGLDAVARAAYDATARALTTERFKRVLASV